MSFQRGRVSVEIPELVVGESTEKADSSDCEVVMIETASCNDISTSSQQPPRKRRRRNCGECDVEVIEVDDKPIEREVQIVKFVRGPRRSPDVEFIKELSPEGDIIKDKAQSGIADQSVGRRVVEVYRRHASLVQTETGEYILIS